MFPDHISNCSDLDTDDLASLLNNWEEASSDAGTCRPASLSGASSLEKTSTLADALAAEQSEPLPEAPPPGPPPMDIEADFTVGESLRFSFLSVPSSWSHVQLQSAVMKEKKLS